MMDTMTTTPPMVTFDTMLRRCAVRWGETGITGVLLPVPAGRPGPAVEDGVDVPPFVRRAIEDMTAVLAGGAPDLRAVRETARSHAGISPRRRQ